MWTADWADWRSDVCVGEGVLVVWRVCRWWRERVRWEVALLRSVESVSRMNTEKGGERGIYPKT